MRALHTQTSFIWRRRVPLVHITNRASLHLKGQKLCVLLFLKNPFCHHQFCHWVFQSILTRKLRSQPKSLHRDKRWKMRIKIWRSLGNECCDECGCWILRMLNPWASAKGFGYEDYGAVLLGGLTDSILRRHHATTPWNSPASLCLKLVDHVVSTFACNLGSCCTIAYNLRRCCTFAYNMRCCCTFACNLRAVCTSYNAILEKILYSSYKEYPSPFSSPCHWVLFHFAQINFVSVPLLLFPLVMSLHV